MKARLLKKAALTILALGLLTGCGAGGPGTTTSGGNPAAPPAPPAEIPAALRFPADLSIDVTTIASSEPAGSSAALVGSGGQFSEEIAFAADLTPTLNLQVNAFLQPLPQFDIPVSSETTTFAIAGLFSNPVKPTDPPVEYDIKIDFADFDLDSDGLNEGCVGHTAGLPICFQIWFDGQRRMAGLFTKFPTADNLGAGEYRMVVHIPADDPEPARDLYVAVVYDHSDPLAKSTDIFERAVPPGYPVDSPGSEAPNFHVQTSQEGPDAIARKSLRVSVDGFPSDFPGVIGTPNSLQYVGQWREDNDFWSGSVATQNIDIQNFSDVCALISMGNSSNQLNCVDLGIDVGGIPFLDFLTPEDIALPADFPESPTF